MIINLFKKILFLTFYVICISSCNSFLKDKYHSARITDINNNLIGDKNFSAKKLTLNSNNVIYFDLDKYDIKLNFLNQLNKHAMFLKNHPYYKIIIEGHTDEQGTPEYNIALGERRANAVKIYLQKNGVSNNQIKTISYGKEKLSILSHNEYANAKNRRAIINY